MDRRSCSKDLLPFVVLVANECSNTGLFTLFKAATLQGMSNFVFVTYAYALATIVLLPVSFFYRRSRVVPPLSFSILSKIALLGVIGCSSQILGYVGISYSSPTLSSAISNLIPAFTFMLAIICRMEKIVVKSRTTLAKVMGSIISISGGLIVTFYKGPSIIIADNSPSFQLPQSNGILISVDTSWVIGGLLLTACNILLTLWFIVQVEILREFPDELTMVFFYNMCAAIVAATVGLFAERNTSAWKIRPDISLISIVCTGIFNKFLSSLIYAWAIHLKGPVYVAMFKPISIVIAVAMGVMFLGDNLHVGSIIGATIISIGFYTVMWGKATEEKEEENVGNQESPTAENVPLLRSYKTVNSEKKIHGSV
ncbi:WAT1-related protein At3g28050-like isoform X1 [Gastrolobium bilobum]|uniref:WAT1-related protein At3g28050-like isoform X1 n=1 Tax=Gastrolobium bilobum TaxID=150636 RepID=UPI002AAFF27F|nr:WAT1-related protein At3g28050-like isoform X1 [Gastrolobium bilobum]